MKLIEISCPNCGAVLKTEADRKNLFCEYCGTALRIDEETVHLQYDDPEEAGYQFEKGRQRAIAEAREEKKAQEREQTAYKSWDAMARDLTSSGKKRRVKHKKKRHTWLWALGWIFIFPLPLTVLQFRKKKSNPLSRVLICAIGWALYFGMGFLAKDYLPWDSQRQEIPSPAVEPAKEINEKPAIAQVPVTEHLTEYQTEVPAENQTEISIETQTEKKLSTIEMLHARQQQSETAPSAGWKNESLKGRGKADIGNREPDYVGIIGYAALSFYEEYKIEKTGDLLNDSLWVVPTYEPDKQFWNEAGTLPHKTEVVVREQQLKHENRGTYSGYLKVERTDDGSQYYIKVINFATKPYWTYKSDVRSAVMGGDVVLEYNQVSDYYPVDSGGEKLEIPDGTLVLGTGLTGSSSRFDRDATDIEAIVYKEWKYGYGGVKCHFNNKDLTIVD